MGFALFSHVESLKPLFARFSSLQTELAKVQKKLAEARRTKYTFSSFIGNSPATMEVKRLARRAALLNAPVLLQGETGTGKELLAHAIHAGGPRAEQPFVTVNVAAIPETLLEAEFFGVAPGAYTGRRPQAAPGQVRAGQRRHPVPGRDRRHAPGPPVQAAAGAPGAGIRAPGLQPGDPGGRAHPRRHQPGPGGHGRGRAASARTSSTG